MVKLVCPNCSASTSVPADESLRSCPQCGAPLADPGAPDPTERRAAVTEPAPDQPDLDAEDGALLADLREAFGFRGDLLDSRGLTGLGPAPTSSTEPLRSLDAAMLPAGTRLDDYEILGELGRGGMGVVYRARQISLGREVALKILPGYARHGAVALQRFRAEAQAAARIHHTNVVSIYAQGECQGHGYYAMELVSGVGLDTAIHSRPDLLSAARPPGGSSDIRLTGGPAASLSARGIRRARARVGPRPNAVPLPSTSADYRYLARLLAEVADALECAHGCGVIHRDIKPHNLLLDPHGRLHVTDFGLARLTDEPHLTVSGEFLGTPAYLSPEQIHNPATVDHRTDIYSLGATIYELLTQRKPFVGPTRELILMAICNDEPTPPRRLNPRIPIDLETICLRAMDRDPARRHPTAAVLAEDLRRFAEGRPILSRRTSRLEKAGKWVRRHKAATAAAATSVGVAALAAALTITTWVGRHRQADDLLRQAYEQLAYFDYRSPELVTEKIDHAAALGADPMPLHLTRALADLGAGRPSQAIPHLQAVLAQNEQDQRAGYLLAWAQNRSRDFAAARTTFERTEQRGPPNSADAWFFRGLALHFDDPLAAADSYRQANALRARENAFYPQAVLHLARALNQQLYGRFGLEGLAEADESLRQLIQQRHYGAYPYYLLSITHRLAAEVYRGSTGTRGDLDAKHYTQALEWAQRGQEAYPDDDRPLTAEAECLESMELYADALDARTQALALATKQTARCEGYHYRWRLCYWTGDLEGALADVARHAKCDPQSRFYAHVYPALILAELDRMPEALAQIRALASAAPGNAQDVLWAATCLRLLGEAAEADALLANRAAAVDYAADLNPPQSEEWVRALYAYCQHGGKLEPLESLSNRVAQPWKLLGEAHFHAAALFLADGDRSAAADELAKAYRSFDGEERYTYHAKLILTKMAEDPAWPPWIKLSWNEAPAPSVGNQVNEPARAGEGEN